jgi:hypothetical protein
MKINIKPNKFSLNNTSDYKKEIEFEPKDAVALYIELLLEYYHFIQDNIKDKKCNTFIVVRGLDTLTNVFKLILLSTKNIDYVCCYTQKAFYYYVEFICQTSEMEKLFLQMTSRDAVIYVYKKTICDINKTIVKSLEPCSQETLEKINLIDEHVNLYKTIAIKNINTNSKIELFETFISKLKNIIVKDVKLVNADIDHLFYTIDTSETFFELIKLQSKNW